MDLKQMRFCEFARALATINEQLNERDAHKRLLDAARVDTPIIDEFLREFQLVLATIECEEKRQEIGEKILRDMSVFLALRHLEQQKQATARASMFPRVAAN